MHCTNYFFYKTISLNYCFNVHVDQTCTCTYAFFFTGQPQGYGMQQVQPGAPPPGYAQPGYGAPPQQGYGAPPQGYGAPPQGYGAPQQGYGAPPQGYAPGFGPPPGRIKQDYTLYVSKC